MRQRFIRPVIPSKTWILVLLSACACTVAIAAGGMASANGVIERGAYLAFAGGCASCHTAEHGCPFAGGLVMNTPFGTITTPNITPDKASGIGNWSDAQFYKAMHEGIGRGGEYLYPVMPFPWYTKLTRDDVQAINASLFSQPPVNRQRGGNDFSFPYNIREALAVWRVAFFNAGQFKPDPAQPVSVNRGDDLVNGLTHCGECHDSRRMAGSSTVFQKPLQGGVIDGWYAPNITSDVRAGIGDWSDAQLLQFLKVGVVPGKSVAVGPMAETVRNLRKMTDADLQSIVAYLRSTPPTGQAQPLLSPDAAAKGVGAQRYLDNCASCHGVKGKGLAGAVPALADNSAVTSEGPQNVIQAVLGGLKAQKSYAPMLAIGAGMSNTDIAEATNFVRQSWGIGAPGNATPEMVGQLRADIDTPMTAGQRNGCPEVRPADLQRAIAGPRSAMRAMLAHTTDDNMPQQVVKLVKRARAAAPKVALADVVNGLTAAYCKLVRADATMDWPAKSLRLGHFSAPVYQQASVGDVPAQVR